MNHLKKYTQFYEDATCDTSNTTGMCAVVSSQPGTQAGDTGSIGSGDIGIVYDNKSKKGKKGGPSQVSDLRDLKPAKTNKIEESLKEEEEKIKDCLVELFDKHFRFIQIQDKGDKISIELLKRERKKIAVEDDYLINVKFDKVDGFYPPSLTFKTELNEYDKNIVEIVEDASNKIMNTVPYSKGNFSIMVVVNENEGNFGELFYSCRTQIYINLFKD
jgi:hypothetical protein